MISERDAVPSPRPSMARPMPSIMVWNGTPRRGDSVVGDLGVTYAVAAGALQASGGQQKLFGPQHLIAS